jgi:hypothetical protein
MFKKLVKNNLKFSYRNIISTNTLPILIRKPDHILISQSWSQRRIFLSLAFDSNKPLNVPIFSFQSGEFTQEAF